MKSKILIALVAIAAAFSWEAEAQREKAPSSYWVVNGQIYDIHKSSLWGKIAGNIVKILPNGIVVETFTIEPVYQAVSTTGDDGIHIRPQIIAKQVHRREKSSGQKDNYSELPG